MKSKRYSEKSPAVAWQPALHRRMIIARLLTVREEKMRQEHEQYSVPIGLVSKMMDVMNGKHGNLKQHSR